MDARPPQAVQSEINSQAECPPKYDARVDQRPLSVESISLVQACICLISLGSPAMDPQGLHMSLDDLIKEQQKKLRPVQPSNVGRQDASFRQRRGDRWQGQRSGFIQRHRGQEMAGFQSGFNYQSSMMNRPTQQQYQQQKQQQQQQQQYRDHAAERRVSMLLTTSTTSTQRRSSNRATALTYLHAEASAVRGRSRDG
jgi:hypothetical protein